LSIPDYEIIARLERVVATLNDTLVQPVPTFPVNTVLVPSVHQQTPTKTRYDINNLYSTDDSSTHYNNNNNNNNNYHHHNSRNRSPSPQKRHNHHQHHNHSHHHHSSSSRNRSKSPRKMVTIDPNSY
jgi:hypothetical protein